MWWSLRCYYTHSQQSQLSAGYLSIGNPPGIIAHCAPDIVVADLHTPISWCASLKSDGSLNAESARASNSTPQPSAQATLVGRAVTKSGFHSSTLHAQQECIRAGMASVVSGTYKKQQENNHYMQPELGTPMTKFITNILELGSLSSLQATLASALLHPFALHTLHQEFLWQICTSPEVMPPLSLIAPWVQVSPAHLTPASWLWLLHCRVWKEEQSWNLCSRPVHWTLSSQIMSLPLRKPDERRRDAPAGIMMDFYPVYSALQVGWQRSTSQAGVVTM
jgi:hypothetical protein